MSKKKKAVTQTLAQQVLDCPMCENDADAKTVRQYLAKLAATVIEQGEGFRGKRAFGTSGWEDDIPQALADEGLLGDADSEYLEYDVAEYRKLISAACELMGNSK